MLNQSAGIGVNPRLGEQGVDKNVAGLAGEGSMPSAAGLAGVDTVAVDDLLKTGCLWSRWCDDGCLENAACFKSDLTRSSTYRILTTLSLSAQWARRPRCSLKSEYPAIDWQLPPYDAATIRRTHDLGLALTSTVARVPSPQPVTS